VLDSVVTQEDSLNQCEMESLELRVCSRAVALCTASYKSRSSHVCEQNESNP
jgi:hypothetical protein